MKLKIWGERKLESFCEGEKRKTFSKKTTFPRFGLDINKQNQPPKLCIQVCVCVLNSRKIVSIHAFWKRENSYSLINYKNLLVLLICSYT